MAAEVTGGDVISQGEPGKWAENKAADITFSPKEQAEEESAETRKQWIVSGAGICIYLALVTLRIVISFLNP